MAALDPPSHGGRLQAARRRFAGAVGPFIDLSTGINPFAYPFADSLSPLPEAAWTRLPEPDEIADLEAAAAKAYGACDNSMVVAGAGSQALLSAFAQHFRPQRVAILSPTYGEYARAFGAAGAHIAEIGTLGEGRDADCLVICNPNNPDGRAMDGTALLAELAAMDFGGLVVVDEAFADLEAPALSLVPQLPHSGLLVLRSFSKTYGLAGLRLSFALGAPDLLAPLRSQLGSWPVSGPAIHIGRGALADRAWLTATKVRLAAAAARLDGLLQQAGLAIVGGTSLFRLGESDRAAALFERLGRAGILVRAFEYRPNWLRFGIPARDEDWQRLSAALCGDRGDQAG